MVSSTLDYLLQKTSNTKNHKKKGITIQYDVLSNISSFRTGLNLENMENKEKLVWSIFMENLSLILRKNLARHSSVTGTCGKPSNQLEIHKF